MKDDRTELQKQFEEQTPTILVEGISNKEYLQTFVTWLHFQVEKHKSIKENIIERIKEISKESGYELNHVQLRWVEVAIKESNK